MPQGRRSDSPAKQRSPPDERPGVLDLPAAVLAGVFARLDAGERGRARLACRAFDAAAVDNLTLMPLGMLLRYPRASPASGTVRVFHGGVALTLARVSGRAKDARRRDALARLLGVAGGPESPWGVAEPNWAVAAARVDDPSWAHAEALAAVACEVLEVALHVRTSRKCAAARNAAAACLAAGRLARLAASLPGPLGPAGFAGAAACGGLRRLDLTFRTANGLRGVEALAACPLLERLRLRGASAGNGAFLVLCQAAEALSASAGRGLSATLASLDVSGNCLDGSSVAAACRAFPRLEEFRSADNLCSADGILALASLRRLRMLDLSGGFVGRPPDRCGLEPFPELADLTVAGADAGGAWLAWVAWAPRLVKLDVSANCLDRLPALHPRARLASLDASWNFIGHGISAELRGPTYASLRRLDASNNYLLDYGAYLVLASAGPGRPLAGLADASLHHNCLSFSGARWLERQAAGRPGASFRFL